MLACCILYNITVDVDVLMQHKTFQCNVPCYGWYVFVHIRDGDVTLLSSCCSRQWPRCGERMTMLLLSASLKSALLFTLQCHFHVWTILTLGRKCSLECFYCFYARFWSSCTYSKKEQLAFIVYVTLSWRWKLMNLTWHIYTHHKNKCRRNLLKEKENLFA